MEKTNTTREKTVKKMGKIGILLIFPIEILFFLNPEDAFFL
jgi:hypothetical protein